MTVTYATLVRVAAEAVGSHCTAGGARIESGMDLDSNGVLADSEVTSTQYVCNGTQGSTGSTGADGSSGSNGLSTLVRVQAEAVGSNCAQGGSAVLAGLDTNANGVLDNSEVTSTSYVCSGATGATGPTGSTGSAGSDGYNSLVLLTTEAAGANCTYGGQRVQSGLDTNRNGVLDSGEVTTTTYLCSAAPADTQWVNVTGGSVQAASNTGYLANASTLVTITLPASPAIGDWIKITGVGTGGWTVAQNAGQRISTRGLPGGMALTWASESLPGSWSGVAMSSDATRQVAVSSAGNVYVSTDSGGSWILRKTGPALSAVASSSDGLKLAACSNGGPIYLSTDGGVNWVDDGSARAWAAIASSADGTRLVAAAYLDGIYTSSDSGASWTLRESSRPFRAVSSSSDGRVLVAGTNGDQLYVSTDYGVTWTARATNEYWWGVTSSADGTRLYASVDTGYIWTSTDYGTTWERQDSTRNWRGITTSQDGRYVVAVTDGSLIYQSTDFGSSWQPTADAGAWTTVASSSDGLTLLAGKVNVDLYGGVRRSYTTLGVTGYISGGQDDALQLQYVGGGTFIPISYVSANLTFTVN
ncbi:hypothetical protein OU995_03460 [Roseateles sp. SL47]|uniref:DUF7151 family protein n=1 Tax=Roseateles sp. SL47 TaxID=2995138 RepID=UPI00226E8BBD|nr:hypothetical protein [Roseateles sp. SL47]WAC73808.1 hypothetical protein OU995_03460 [Roseateles sp. SL47]